MTTQSDDRARWLTTRFGVYEGVTGEDAQRELLNMGGPAIPALLDALDGKQGWTAGMLLGVLGDDRPEVIAALRQRADTTSWFAKALGFLGDLRWLSDQAPRVAADGLAAPLLDVGWERAPAHLERQPLDLEVTEEWLSSVAPETRERFEGSLKPGRAYRKLQPRDLSVTLQALQSQHPALRWIAASMLGSRRRLLPRNADRILPRLAETLRDDHPWVRRLACLAIDRWGNLAAPYVPELEALRDDPDEGVRRATDTVLNQRAGR